MGRVHKPHTIILDQNEQAITYDGEKIILPYALSFRRKDLNVIDKYCMYYYGRRFTVDTEFSKGYGECPSDYPVIRHRKLFFELRGLFETRVYANKNGIPLDNPEGLDIQFIPEDLSEEEKARKRYKELLNLSDNSPNQYKELQFIDAMFWWIAGELVFGDRCPPLEDFIREPTASEPFLSKEEYMEDIIYHIRIPESRVPAISKRFPVPQEIIVSDEEFEKLYKEIDALDKIKNPNIHVKPKPKIKYDSRQNDGYTYEPALFKAYLFELLNSLSFPCSSDSIIGEIGRPDLPIHDKLFCNIDRINMRMTSRQYPESADARVALEDGYVECIPSFNSLTGFLANEKLTPILNALLQLSASPLSVCETITAVDSSGFRTITYGDWYRIKYDTEIRKNLSVIKRKELKAEAKEELKLMKKQRMKMWKKLHIIVGVKTGVIIALRITKNEGEGTSDTVNFQPLLEDATKYFDVEECTADKGYSSRHNFSVAQRYGIKLYCPFRCNATIKQKGVKSWYDMFYESVYNSEEFSKHYGLRNNVEASFGAIKKSLGEELASKTETAQINELYCKCIAYNIRKLIMASALELIDEPEFAQAKA